METDCSSVLEFCKEEPKRGILYWRHSRIHKKALESDISFHWGLVWEGVMPGTLRDKRGSSVEKDGLLCGIRGESGMRAPSLGM